MKREERLDVVRGSGNVFRDLGHKDAGGRGNHQGASPDGNTQPAWLARGGEGPGTPGSSGMKKGRQSEMKKSPEERAHDAGF